MSTINQPLEVTALFVRTFIKAWDTQVRQINKILESVSDDDLLKEIAPGKNRGVYLLGHLTAVNDGMLPLLEFGRKLYPQLEEVFITTPDTKGHEFPSIQELKQYWNNVNDQLMQHFNDMEGQEWLTKHAVVSAEDFAKEPHRNKLSVLISRTTHLSYHLGQLIFLKEKK